MTETSKRISLVLGSGGARGLAHIGIIRSLEEQGYRIESISGCSIGALIGGIYAAGRLEEYAEWISGIDKFDIFSLLDFSFGRSGLVKGEKLIAKLKEMVGETRIEELPISFTAVAADIVREREVWISKGPLFDAIRASISLPLFFTPFRYKGVHLVDGGIFDPVPIAPTYHDVTDLTVAVNLNGSQKSEKGLRGQPTKKGGEEENGLQLFREKVGAFIARFWPDDETEAKEEWDMFYIASQSIDAMQGVIARQKLAAHPPDLLIEIPRDTCGILDFDQARELIRLGYDTAEKRLAEFKAR